ncbi:MAG: hypothetical protein V4750_14695 [Pseudomonadota bacterium]
MVPPELGFVAVDAAMVLGCLDGVEAAMTVQGIPFGAGGVEQAVRRLAAD